MIGVLIGVVVATALIAFYVVGYLMVTPPVIAATGSPREANLTLQTVAALGFGPHPDWVSYLVENPQGKWVHSTNLRVPAHSLVHVTIYQFDTATGLRNPFWGKPQGLVGEPTVDGKPFTEMKPDDASHTFAIPGARSQRSVEGRRRRREEPVQRRAVHAGQAHTKITFTFRTGDPRHVPLAVLRPLRRRVHPRLRRPDAEPRLHGRAPPRRMTETASERVPRHGVRILVIWLALCLIAVPLIVFVLGDHLPPGRMSAEASDQTNANIVLIALLVPIALLVVVYFVYSLVVFRAHGESLEDGPPDHGNGVIQLTWVGATAMHRARARRLGQLHAGPDRPRGRWRTRPVTEREAGRIQDGPARPGDRPAVDVDVPLAGLRRVRDEGHRAPRRHA